jgi:uncharacterized coiled-coil DUF342 family protein
MEPMYISIAANALLAIVSTMLKRALDASEKRVEACEERADIQQREISTVREMLPNMYVRRDEYRDDINEIKGMLVRIFDRLDDKADKL